MNTNTRHAHHANQQDQALLEDRRQAKPPPLYKVFLLNDDFTPMDFVVSVLQEFFAMNREKAIKTMLQVHVEGRGLCGIYPFDIAHSKVEKVKTFARTHQHPLICTMEEDNDCSRT